MLKGVFEGQGPFKAILARAGATNAKLVPCIIGSLQTFKCEVAIHTFYKNKFYKNIEAENC